MSAPPTAARAALCRPGDGPALSRAAPTASNEDAGRTALSRRLLAVLDFGLAHLPRLDAYAPFWEGDGEADAVVRFQDKVVAETALLLLLVGRVPDLAPQVQHAAEALADHVETSGRSERNRVLLLRHPRAAPALATPHAALVQLGRPDAEMDRIVRGAFAGGQAEVTERIPYRALEARWLRALVDPSQRGQDGRIRTDDLLPLTTLTSPVHPITMGRSDAYAVTHAVMYATDFGRLPPPAGLDADRVGALVDASLAWLMGTEDLDLVVEMVYTAALMRQPWSAYVRAGWRYVEQTWDALGFLPSPSFSAETFSGLSGLEAEAYVFHHLYHTLYVGGLLCAALLTAPPVPEPEGPPWVPDTREAVHAGRGVVARARAAFPDGLPAPDGPLEVTSRTARLGALLDRLLPGKTSWREAVLAGGDDGETILADAAAIHAAKAYDLRSLVDALDLAAERPGPPSLTFVEALAFLCRQQLASGAIGAHFVAAGAEVSPSAGPVTRHLADRIERYADRCVPSA